MRVYNKYMKSSFVHIPPQQKKRQTQLLLFNQMRRIGNIRCGAFVFACLSGEPSVTTNNSAALFRGLLGVICEYRRSIRGVNSSVTVVIGNFFVQKMTLAHRQF